MLRINTFIWKTCHSDPFFAWINKYSINTVIKHYERIVQASHFNLASVSENSIPTILKSTQVSKATGLDSLSGRFLKDGAKFLAKPISDLCNLSINSENIPDLWTTWPLYKKGSLTWPCNCRLISLLPLISKVVEKVIHDQVSTFLNSKNLLYTYQSSFRKKYSTDFCHSYLNDNILKGFDKGLMTSMILIDLQKAFDTIDHDVLLQKLYAIDFSKHTVNWLQSYLSNRSFLVNLRNNFSKPASVSCGVPQGSILGPLLILIDVNDMSQSVKCDLFLYADDTCLVCKHRY